MNLTEHTLAITKELECTISQIEPAGGEKLTDLLLSSKKIFVAGAGRSGFMVKAFAMRLMHMGFESHVVGETVTPNIEASDVLIIGSGSGETESLASMARRAKKIGAALVLLGISPGSTIGELADVVIKIPAPSPKVKAAAGFSSIQPMGSLFEQCLLLALDGVILRLMEKQGIDSDTMFCKHANLE